MREADARAVLLVRAFEEADDDGRLLSPRERERATARTREALKLGSGTALDADQQVEFVVARARLLTGTLAERVPRLHTWLSGLGSGRVWKPLALLAALLVGWSSQTLGPAQRINLLALPMLGVLAWNLAVYLALIVAALRGRRVATHRPGATAAGAGGAPDAARDTRRSRAAGRGHGAAPDDGPGGWLGWLLGQGFRLPHPDKRAEAATLSHALQRFAELSRGVLMPVLVLHARTWLHLCALVLALGMLTDMYVRGLVLAYDATWESTFLGAGSVAAWLDVLLGPASWLLGIAIPDVAPLEAPGHAPAAAWIHLFAGTLVLWVILPRAVLAWLDSRRAARLAADLDLDVSVATGDAYYGRLAGRGPTRMRRVLVLPYAEAPETRRRDALTALLHDVFGTRAEVTLAAAVPYGEGAVLPPDDPERPGDERAGRAIVALFGLGQLPETEVHAEWLQGLRDRMDDEDALLVLVDGGRFAAAMAEPRRVDERRRAWERVVREADLTAVPIDLAGPASPAELQAAGDALWSPGRGAAGGVT